MILDPVESIRLTERVHWQNHDGHIIGAKIYRAADQLVTGIVIVGLERHRAIANDKITLWWTGMWISPTHGNGHQRQRQPANRPVNHTPE